MIFEIKQFMLRVKKNNKYVKLSKKCILGRNTTFYGKNYIGSSTSVRDSIIGYGSYVGCNSVLENVSIGKFCSIANNVVIIRGTHPINYISTHPAFYSKKNSVNLNYNVNSNFNEYKYLDESNKICCKIGNDVWIGHGASIMEGLTIGDGAIIAAGAVVTKDVLPYEIVAGVPAKCIKKRFSEEKIDFLLNLKWWDKDENWFKSNARYFDDFDLFKSKI